MSVRINGVVSREFFPLRQVREGPRPTIDLRSSLGGPGAPAHRRSVDERGRGGSGQPGRSGESASSGTRWAASSATRWTASSRRAFEGRLRRLYDGRPLRILDGRRLRLLDAPAVRDGRAAMGFLSNRPRDPVTWRGFTVFELGSLSHPRANAISCMVTHHTRFRADNVQASA